MVRNIDLLKTQDEIISGSQKSLAFETANVSSKEK